MMRILAVAVLVSGLLVIAGPRALSAITALRSEATTLDAMASNTTVMRGRLRQSHWVPVADYTRALARGTASTAERRSMRE